MIVKLPNAKVVTLEYEQTIEMRVNFKLQMTKTQHV